MVEVTPMFKTAPLPWVSPPAPLKVVATVRVPLLVYVPVTLMFGMERPLAPLIVFAVPLKVIAPVVDVNVPSFCRLPEIVAAMVVLLQAPPLLTVTSPNVFVPVELVIDSVPEMVVVPATVIADAPKVSVPVLTVNVPSIVVAPEKETPPEVLLMVILL